MGSVETDRHERPKPRKRFAGVSDRTLNTHNYTEGDIEDLIHSLGYQQKRKEKPQREINYKSFREIALNLLGRDNLLPDPNPLTTRSVARIIEFAGYSGFKTVTLTDEERTETLRSCYSIEDQDYLASISAVSGSDGAIALILKTIDMNNANSALVISRRLKSSTGIRIREEAYLISPDGVQIHDPIAIEKNLEHLSKARANRTLTESEFDWFSKSGRAKPTFLRRSR